MSSMLIRWPLVLGVDQHSVAYTVRRDSRLGRNGDVVSLMAGQGHGAVFWACELHRSEVGHNQYSADKFVGKQIQILPVTPSS
jgi:hypothetical protein